jgi:hypothetical protein
MGKFLAVVLGLAAMAGGVLLILFVWGPLVRDLIFACIPLVLIFGGLIAFVAGISSMKDAARAKQLEEETEEELPEETAEDAAEPESEEKAE